MPIDGVSVSVQTAMESVHATVVTERGVLLRACEHDIRHQVGHLDPRANIAAIPSDRVHEQVGPCRLLQSTACCGCCGNWR
jgi:hypothetical protein